ncbi:hypothetical protein [Brevundimonas subvibrioides]|uniref:Uncharacterized protein n=1 Tax=Brevundimonas subvibrioides (strain ATCC 15264 / DSM 4735 / LMG 14903 / NBRC 16000 / CB 81) TaxID=633149 RepID=D9QKN9_BRESC|nr:hypothetical protein [Brevundimonas subvibrioides]ADK99864.1 hypothetical protein Bresu_0550 [Brevundimonas subvibrioides ATCC 15264]
MVWGLRICLCALVLAYAAWLGWPMVEALSSGQTVAQVREALAPDGSRQAMALAALLLATIALYGLGGLATAAGLTWAPGLFFAGFAGEIGLRLAAEGGVPSPALDLAARAEQALRPFGVLVDTTPLSLATLLVSGLCIMATGVWRGQSGEALTRVWTGLPPRA